MTFVHQEVWEWPIAAYLFLGGLGGATFALSALADLFEEADKKMLSIAVLSSMIFVGIGTVFLLGDMLQPLKAFLALSNPLSWIFWGVIFINVYFAAATVYLIPLLEAWPPLKPIIQKIPRFILNLLFKFHRWAALGGATMGFLVAIYTGLLISGAPGIAFWNTPAMPLLFVVSAFSTGAAYLMLLARISQKSHIFIDKFEELDAALIVIEMIILGAYFNFSFFLPNAARKSASYLMHSPGFFIGFFLFGLLVPLGIETYGIFFAKEKHKIGHLILPGTLLVLLGGFLLRYYVIQAGVFQYPW